MKLILIIVSLTLVAGVLSACVSSAVYTSRVEETYPPIGKMVSAGETRMHVIQKGESGPPVLMIHGASANAREFTWSLAPRLEADHRVFMVDRPGHGYSERPENAQQLGTQADLMAGVLDQLAPGEKAVVVGHSFGGGVALRLALDHPDKVQALVLLAPVSHDWGGGGETWYNKYAGNPVIGGLFSQLVPLVGPGQVAGGIESVFDPKPAPNGYLEKAAIGLLFRPPNFRANAKDVNALQAELAAQQGRYGELALPIIVYSGAQDTVISPPLHVGKLKDQASNLDLRKLPETGHMPHHAHGEDVAADISRLASGGEAS